VLQCVAVCCSVLQCVAVCCSVLQCVAVCCSVLQCVAVCCNILQYFAVCCSTLQCVAECCSMLQCVAVCCCSVSDGGLHYMAWQRLLRSLNCKVSFEQEPQICIALVQKRPSKCKEPADPCQPTYIPKKTPGTVSLKEKLENIYSGKKIKNTRGHIIARVGDGRVFFSSPPPRKHVTWLVDTCDMWHDSFFFLFLSCLFIVATTYKTCDMSHAYVWQCDMTQSYVWHDSCICVTWPIPVSNSYVTCNNTCAMMHSYVWGSF